jgi:hypothetical protein
MRLLAAIAVLPLVGAAQDDERLDVDVLPEEFERKWAAAEKALEWKSLFELYLAALEQPSGRLARPDREASRWVGLPWSLARRLADMPDAPREPYETLAAELLRGTADEAGRRKIIDRFAFTRAAQSALEALANEAFDEGRTLAALRDWSRALEVRSTPDLVARLAHAHATGGDRTALAALLGRAAEAGWKGEVSVGGRRRELRDFLAGLRTPEDAAPLRRPSRPPAPTNEIPLGRFDFKNDGNTFGRGVGTSWPAWGRHGGRELVVVTNGLKAVAIDPARARGGTLEDAVEWRFPKEGTLRYYMPTPYGGPHPLLGAALDRGRAYVTMFHARQRQYQSGRRPDRYEGPAAIRALSLATGELLWTTEDLMADETDVDAGSRKKLEEVEPGLRKKLKDLDQNFWFAGPPLVRGDRLYATLMTLLPQRQCYLLCLEGATGKPVWFTKVASAPPNRHLTTVPASAEADGQVVVSTGFGAVASVHAGSGEVEWVLQYAPGGPRYGVSPPVLHRSAVYVLPQDAEELLAIDRWTGRELELPELSEDVSWSRLLFLVGREGEWLALAGVKNYALRITDGRVVELVDSDGPRVGRAALGPGVLYVPTRAALHVYDVPSWKPRDSVAWTFGDESPNLVAAESLLLILGDRLELAASRASLQARFGQPGRPEACRQLGQILEAAGRGAEAVPHYRRALAAWEKEPAWQESAEGVRKKLAELAEKLGPEFPKD